MNANHKKGNPRDDGHSAAEPQPKLTTDYTDGTDTQNPCNPRNPWSEFFAGCEQLRLLQCIGPVKSVWFRVFRVFRGKEAGTALAAATACAMAHYTFGDWARNPHVALWREGAFWAGMPAAAIVPVLHWVAWSVLSLGRVKPARVILVASVVLCLGDLLWLLVWLNLKAASDLFNVPVERVTVEYWDWWGWWLPSLLLAGNAVLARRWWRLARAYFAQVAADGSRRHLASSENAPTAVGGYTRSTKPEPREHSRLSIVVRAMAALAGSFAAVVAAAYLVLPRMPINETTVSLAATFLGSAKWESDFEFLAQNPALQGKRLGAILTHAELAHLQRRQFYQTLDENTYQQFVLSPIVDALPVSEIDWRRTLWEAFYPRVRNEHDPVAAARVVVRSLRERVGIDPSYAYRVGPETIWELGMADEKGFERIYVAALRSVGVAARLDEAGQAQFWDGHAWLAAPRPLPSFWSGDTALERTPLTLALSPSEGQTEVWTFWSRQPKGLPEGSRGSPRVYRGGDLRAAVSGMECTPDGVPDRAISHQLPLLQLPSGLPTLRVGHSFATRPSGGRFPAAPKRPPATFCQPSGLGSMLDVPGIQGQGVIFGKHAMVGKFS